VQISKDTAMAATTRNIRLHEGLDE
jgi:hypothetical protein